ncbi:MAG: hypothetical protein NVSMB64_13340 [Candidatus Velthaea sp.]
MGIFIVGAGCVFVALGAVQVVADIILSFRSRSAAAARAFAAEEINALAALTTALARLPHFALMVLIGIVLVAVGQRLIAGL